jgi:hypothetical protein
MPRKRWQLNLALIFQAMKILKNISETLRLFGSPPIVKWLWNLLRTNILKLLSRGFMMRTFMGGRLRTSMAAVTRMAGLWLSSRQLKTLSLAVSLQLSGNPHLCISLSPPLNRSYSVWMRERNTPSLEEIRLLLNVTKVAVQCSGQLICVTYWYKVILTITLPAFVNQIRGASICLQLKESAIKKGLLPLMEGISTLHPKNLRCSEYS